VAKGQQVVARLLPSREIEDLLASSGGDLKLLQLLTPFPRDEACLNIQMGGIKPGERGR